MNNSIATAVVAEPTVINKEKQMARLVQKRKKAEQELKEILDLIDVSRYGNGNEGGNGPLKLSEQAAMSDLSEVNRILAKKQETTIDSCLRAEARLRDGGYGICQKCRGRIQSGRLQAIPDATTCKKCVSENL